MATTETVTKRAAHLLVDNGSTSTGSVKTAQISLGTLSAVVDDWDAQKALNISKALVKCLTKDYYSTRLQETSQLRRALTQGVQSVSSTKSAVKLIRR